MTLSLTQKVINNAKLIDEELQKINNKYNKYQDLDSDLDLVEKNKLYNEIMESVNRTKELHDEFIKVYAAAEKEILNTAKSLFEKNTPYPIGFGLYESFLIEFKNQKQIGSPVSAIEWAEQKLNNPDHVVNF